MEKLPRITNETVNLLYVKFNLLCNYQEVHKYDPILEMALRGLKDEYGFNVEFAKNIARQKGASPEEVRERFKPYDLLSSKIDNALFNYLKEST